MRKFFALLIALSCSGAFAVNPDSELEREFMDSAMEDCVDGMLEEDISLGIASEYCKCLLAKALPKLSVTQLAEYYNHGHEIEQLMENTAKECVEILMKGSDTNTKEYFVKDATEQCVQGAMETGVGLGIASEYCKCAVNKMFENLSIDQLTEYYNHGREIENLMNGAAQECVSLLVN